MIAVLGNFAHPTLIGFTESIHQMNGKIGAPVQKNLLRPGRDLAAA